MSRLGRTRAALVLALTAALVAPGAAGAQRPPGPGAAPPPATVGIGALAPEGLGPVAAAPAPSPPSTTAAPAGGQPARPPRAPRSPGPAAIGLSASLRLMTVPEMRRAVRHLRSAGARYSREDLDWGEIEPSRGRYRWARYDAVVREAARGGLGIVALPIGSPAWATGEPGAPPTSGPALAAFTRFVRQAIQRYGTNGVFWIENPRVPRRPITLWDIWNEPYVEFSWGGERPDPVAYARMFKRVVSAVEDVDPNARFMLEAETGSNGYPWPQPPFLGAMLDAVPDLGRYADIVSVHPYTGEEAPDRCREPKQRRGVDQDYLATRFELCRVREVRRILDAKGARRTRIWITEVGWSTAPRADDAISEQQQAAYVRALFAQLRRWQVVDGVLLYHYRLAERDPRDWHQWLGLVAADGRPKPAWTAFANEAHKGLPAAPR